MDFQNNKTILEELTKVKKLLNEVDDNNYFLKSKSEENFSRKMAEIKKIPGQLPVPSVFTCFPTFSSVDPSTFEKLEIYKNSKGKLLKISAIATAALFLIYSFTHWEFLNAITVIGVMVTIVLTLLYSSSTKAYKEKKAIYDKSLDTYNKTNADFLSALETFEEEKASCILAAKEYSKKYNEAFTIFMDEVVKKIEAEGKAAERIKEIEKELADNDIIVPEHYHLVDDIITNLKSGRSDSYKEALNLAIQEEKEHWEMEQRMAEEERRTKLLAMQAEEERRHNQAMERQQRERDEAMLQEQRRQHHEELREQSRQSFEARRQSDMAAAEAQKQVNQTKAAGIAKCASCANSRNCPSHIKNNGSGLNCGGYVPYGSR